MAKLRLIDKMKCARCNNIWLANCASVEVVLKADFLGPRFLLVADAKEIAYIEVGANGKTVVKCVKNGTLAHIAYKYLTP